ncbi:MAG: DUF3187 family protein [Acidobacteriota bacterium]
MWIRRASHIVAVAILLCYLAMPATLSAQAETQSSLAEPTDRGPLLNINEYPLESIFLSWPLLDPEPVPRGRHEFTVGLVSSNFFRHDVGTEGEVYLDGESLRLNLGARYGLADRWDAELQISLIRYGGGVLDGPIRSFERFFGFPHRGPQSGVNNQFRYSITRDGDAVIDRGGAYGGLGDTRILLRRSLGEAARFSYGAVAAVKLPTGQKGLGSGGVDAGLGVLGKYVEGRWRFRGEVDAILMSDFEEIPARNRMELKLGLEYVRGRLSLYLQTDFKGSAITWGKRQLDKAPGQATVGVKFAKPANVMHQIFMIEDLTRTSPDITYGYAVEW